MGILPSSPLPVVSNQSGTHLMQLLLRVFGWFIVFGSRPTPRSALLCCMCQVVLLCYHSRPHSCFPHHSRPSLIPAPSPQHDHHHHLRHAGLALSQDALPCLFCSAFIDYIKGRFEAIKGIYSP